MPAAMALSLLIGISTTFAQPVVLDCGNPRIIATENPHVPWMPGGSLGGLDADYPGDDLAFTLSKGKTGKQYYGSPDALLVTVELSAAAKPLVLRIGYLAYKYGTSACEVTWDGEVVATLNCRDTTTDGEDKVAEIGLSAEQSTPGRHVLKLTENSGVNGQYARIDAIAFEGDPDLVIITPQGRRFKPRAMRPRKAETIDTSAPFYRSREGAPICEVFDDACLAKLPARWAIASSAGGVLSFKDGAIFVPAPPAQVHGLTSPARGSAGGFYLQRKAQFPDAGLIRLRLKSVYAGDDSVNLVSFWGPEGKDKRYFCRFRGHLALSDGKFVHNIIPIDDDFHDLKVVYGDGEAQVFCDGKLARAKETWPTVDEVRIGHPGAWKGYGIGVAMESFFVYPTPSENPVTIKALREGQPVAGLALRIKLGDRDIEAETNEDGAVVLELSDELDYPQTIELSAANREKPVGRGEALPGDEWVLNLSAKRPGLLSAVPKTKVDVSLAATSWWLDFGGEGTTVAPGFEAVGPNALAAGRAFGWRGEHDLAPGELPEGDHPLAADFLDVTAPDTTLRFEIATPPGDYVVSLICGAPDTGPDFEVWCEGKSAAAVRQMRPGSCDIYSFPASTEDGVLSLRFEVGGCLGLAGMIVTPADPDDPAVAETKRFARDLQTSLVAVRAMSQGIMPDPPDPGPEPELSAADKARGFVAFPHSYMRPVYASSRPKPDEVGATATAFACPGEYEPVLFSIWPLEALREARVTVADLKTADGATIPASAITVRHVRIWPQRFGKNTFRRIPELIEDIPPAGLNLRPAQVKTFWLTVKIPEDQAPGDYRGQAAFSCDAGQLNVPIRFEVLPIHRASLDDLIMGMYWSFGKSAGRNLETARKQFLDMREHGCNTLTMHEPVKITKTDQGETFDFSTLDQLLQLHKEMGFTAPVPYHALSAHTDRGLYKRLVAALVAEGKQRNWPELLFYPVDEPGRDEKKIALCKELCELIKTVPGARTYVTTNGRGVDAAALDPFLDIRCYQHLSYNPEEARKTKEAGDLLWFYTGPPSSILITRMNEGIWWFRSEMTAHFYWHYCYPIGDPWYDFDGKGDYCATYPGDDGPIATIGWEGVREGLDDLRYFRTLEARINTARNKGLAKDLADEAETYLLDLCERIPADGADIKQARTAIELEEYVAIRRQVAERIMALDAALAARP